MAELDLEGRTALVTGGSRGIGAAISLALAKRGADVAVNYHASKDGAETVAEQIREMGRKAIAVQGDVTDITACKRMVATTNDTLGSIGILINNAGLSSVSEKQPFITEMQDDQLQRLLNAHVFGSLHMCRLVVPQMRELGRGDVIMISSVATTGYAQKMGVYGIAKAGMEAMAYTLAKEERKNGIRVNVVAPGLVDTDMGRRLMNFTRGIEDIRTMDKTRRSGSSASRRTSRMRSPSSAAKRAATSRTSG